MAKKIKTTNGVSKVHRKVRGKVRPGSAIHEMYLSLRDQKRKDIKLMAKIAKKHKVDTANRLTRLNKKGKSVGAFTLSRGKDWVQLKIRSREKAEKYFPAAA